MNETYVRIDAQGNLYPAVDAFGKTVGVKLAKDLGAYESRQYEGTYPLGALGAQMSKAGVIRLHATAHLRALQQEPLNMIPARCFWQAYCKFAT